jgi:ATP-dependent RNA helicase SUPV3L1/SUV3
MIADTDRGFAWTRALMGIRCKEIHVCGGLEAKGLVQKIAEACSDDFELKSYERFSALKVASKSLASKPDQRNSYRAVSAVECEESDLEPQPFVL